MINEFRTSKLCNVCESCCSLFLKRESHKPKDIDKKTKKGKLIEVWGLTPKKIKRLIFLFYGAPKNNSYELFFLVTLCENKKCSLIHNRDKNSSLNMYKITQSILNGKGRPEKYCREIKK